MSWSSVGSVVTLILTATFGVLAYRLYRRLKAWYDESPKRLWEGHPRRWVLPVVGVGIGVVAGSWLAAYLGLADGWAACTASALVGFGSRMLVMLPHRGAQRIVMSDPLSYPMPQTPPHQQVEIAVKLLGGLVLFLGLLIGGLVLFAGTFF